MVVQSHLTMVQQMVDDATIAAFFLDGTADLPARRSENEENGFNLLFFWFHTNLRYHPWHLSGRVGGKIVTLSQNKKREKNK